MLVNVRLYSYLYTLLLNLYATKRFPHHLIVTLALLLTGLILGAGAIMGNCLVGATAGAINQPSPSF